MARTQRKPVNKGVFKKGDDPRRRKHVDGTNGGGTRKGRHAQAIAISGRRGNFLTQQLIASLNDMYKELGKTGKRTTKTNMTKFAKMCEALTDNACEGDMDAIEFIWNRVEGKLTQRVEGDVKLSADDELADKLRAHPTKRLQEAALVLGSLMTDDERQMAENRLIDITPNRP